MRDLVAVKIPREQYEQLREAAQRRDMFIGRLLSKCIARYLGPAEPTNGEKPPKKG